MREGSIFQLKAQSDRKIDQKHKIPKLVQVERTFGLGARFTSIL